MRFALFMLALCICGCDLGTGGGSPPTEVIRSGKHRLTMKYVPAGPIPGGGNGFDFHSLIWETENGDFWSNRVVITEQQFQAGSTRARWVSDLDSFDPKSGNAIIKVAEGNAPTNATNRSVHFIYSWREWNLLTNREVRFIKTCRDPFDKLE